MKKYIIIGCLGLLLGSCDSFLDEAPSKSSNLPLETIEQLDALLGNFNNFYNDNSRSAVLCTDDWATTAELYHGYNGSTFSSMEVIQNSTWDVEYTPYDGKEGFWGYEYKKIFYANMVLHYLDDVSGTDEQKAELKAEANLIKAYSYWNLANTFCLPYSDETKNEPGITIKNSVSFEETTSRSTLEETYVEIERCIGESLKSTTPLIKDNVFRAWRGNISGARAFAARFYLSINDYTKALQYAEAALKDHSDLMDYNTEMTFYETTVNLGDETITVNFPMTYRDSYTDMISFKEFYYARFSYFAYSWYAPSQDLIDCYDQTSDLRYIYHIVEDYSLVMDRTSISYPGYIFSGSYNIPSGPTTSEMLLIKAEALTRTGQWQQGMSTLEQLRVKRIDNSAYAPLIANSEEEAVMHIIEERRRERPFAFTWYDYRRYNSNEVDYDDVNLSREFYPYNGSTVLDGEEQIDYMLPKGDRRWARPIPNTEIESSLGKITQNIY